MPARVFTGALAFTALSLSACGPDRPGGYDLALAFVRDTSPLEARCIVDVVGTGPVDVEREYLPRVVMCENGAADYAALKAQAVAARSYLYYRLATGDGTIEDGQSDQVYSCGREPRAEHYQAVADTEGEVLRYRGIPVASFYVAGAIPSDRASCVAAPGDEDRFDTERFVTVNWEASGPGVQQSTLGWIHPENHANRGCQSQNGAHCLAEAGWSYEDILLFYYGADIAHVAATGACATPSGLPHGCGVVVDPGARETVYDEGDLCFVKGCASAPGFFEAEGGVFGASLLSPAQDGTADNCFGRWRLSFAEAGRYEVSVHVPDMGTLTRLARYRVRHVGGDDEVEVELAAASGWVSLGAFEFAAGGLQHIELGDRALEAGDGAAGTVVVFDAVRVRPATDGSGTPPPEDAGFARHTDDGGAPDGGSAPPVTEVGCRCVRGGEVSGVWASLALCAGALIVSGARRRRMRSCEPTAPPAPTSCRPPFANARGPTTPREPRHHAPPRLEAPLWFA